VLVPRPVEAQRSGVLVGLSTGRTLWIAPDANGGIRVLERDGVLVVPRKTGFWKTGFTKAETPPDTLTYPPPDREPDSTQMWWGRACNPDICHDWFALALWAAPIDHPTPRADYPSDDFRNDLIWTLRREGGSLSGEVTFLSPDYISLTEHYEFNGSASGTHGHIVSLDSLGLEPFILGLGEEVAGDPIAIDSALAAGFLRECTRQYRTSDDVDGPDMDDLGEAEWSRYIARKNGQWRLYWLFTVSGGGGRGARFSCELPYRLPVAVVGRDRLTPAWNAIARAVPELVDAVSSPSGDLVVALRGREGGRELLVFAPAGGRLGTAKATIPIEYGEIVMAEWATGRSVARWTAELSRYLQPRGGARE